MSDALLWAVLIGLALNPYLVFILRMRDDPVVRLGHMTLPRSER